MINTQVLKGNLINQDYSTAFTLSQGDKGVPFRVELLENGTPYTLLSDDIVTIEWLKPNGNPFLQEGNIKYGTNYIEFTTPESVAQYSGSGSFNIIISNSDVRKGTIRREYKVVPTSMKPGSVSEDTITDAITELRELSVEIADTVQNNQDLINNNQAATKQDIANVNSSLEDIANNILNYGGNYNGVNSNDNAFNLAKEKGSVFFPQNETKNAVYYFENTPNMDNVVIESQENVILSFPTTNYISFKNSIIKDTIKIISRDRDNTGELVKNNYSKTVYNAVYQENFGIKTINKYNLNNLKGTRREIGNNSVCIDITAYITKSGDKLNWSKSSLDFQDTKLNLYEIEDFEIGYMYEFTTDVDALTDNDILYITISNDSNVFSAFQSNRKNKYYKGNTSSGTWQGIEIGDVISPAYRISDGGSCIWGIRVISNSKVEIYINNIFITTLELDNFNRIGFGFNSIESTISTNFIQDIMYSKVDKCNYGRNLKIAGFGDSLSFGEGSSVGWLEFLDNLLVGYRGISQVHVDNYAVSGETSGDQFTRLNKIDLTQYDFTCIMVGTNDLGQKINLTTFENNIRNMITKVKDSNSIPIIGIFPMTTSNELTGHGVSNLNYYNGGKYRSTIMRVCAEENVIIADIMGELGEIGSDNKQLRDNIHINSSYNIFISKSFANSIKYYISNDM